MEVYLHAFLISVVGGRVWLISHCRHFNLPWKELTWRTVQYAGWTPESLWTLWWKKSLHHCRE